MKHLIDINGKNIEITKGMRDHLEKKLSYFEKFIGDAPVKVSVSVRKNLEKIETFFKYKGHEVKSTVHNKDFYATAPNLSKIFIIA